MPPPRRTQPFGLIEEESRVVVKPKLRIIFLCTGNSCRSQMAEGWARALKGEVLEPYSAGLEAHGLNPRAVAVMREAGVDISAQRSKTVDELPDLDFDCVVTLCARAQESCPLFLGAARTVHVGFEDPAAVTGPEEQIMMAFRRVRDEIKAFVEGLPDNLDTSQTTQAKAC